MNNFYVNLLKTDEVLSNDIYFIVMVYDSSSTYHDEYIQKYIDVFNEINKPIDVLTTDKIEEISDMGDIQEGEPILNGVLEYIVEKLSSGTSVILDTMNNDRVDRAKLLKAVKTKLPTTINDPCYKFMCSMIVQLTYEHPIIDIPTLVTESFDIVEYVMDKDLVLNSYRSLIEITDKNVHNTQLKLIDDNGNTVMITLFDLIEDLHAISHKYIDQLASSYNTAYDYLQFSIHIFLSSVFNGALFMESNEEITSYIGTFDVSGIIQLMYLSIDRTIYENSFYLTRDSLTDNRDDFVHVNVACAMQYLDILYNKANLPGNIFRDLNGNDFVDYIWDWAYPYLSDTDKEVMLPYVKDFSKDIKVCMVILNTYFQVKYNISNIGKFFVDLDNEPIEKFYKCKCVVKDDPTYVDCFEDVFMTINNGIISKIVKEVVDKPCKDSLI